MYYLIFQFHFFRIFSIQPFYYEVLFALKSHYAQFETVTVIT